MGRREMMNNDLRARTNARAGRLHELSRLILGLDWYDTESQARRVIEFLAESERPKMEAKPAKESEWWANGQVPGKAYGDDW